MDDDEKSYEDEDDMYDSDGNEVKRKRKYTKKSDSSDAKPQTKQGDSLAEMKVETETAAAKTAAEEKKIEIR